MPVTPDQVSFAGLSNTLDEHRVPLGFAYAADNATFVDGTVKGGPRYGDTWARSSPHSGDVGMGLFYAEYGTAREYLAVVKHNGDSTSRLYSVNPTTGVFTAVTRTSPPTGEDPAAIPDGQVYFAQYEDKVFAVQVATGALYTRIIGGGASEADRWRLFRPEFLTSASLAVSTERPAYASINMKDTGETLSYVANGTGKPDWDTYTAPSASGIRLAKANTNGNGYVDGTFVLTKSVATSFADAAFFSFRITKDVAGGDPAILHFAKVYLSDDIAGAVNSSWLASQAIVHETFCTFEDAGDSWVVRCDLRNVSWGSVDKTAIKRFGFRLTVQRFGPPFTSYLDLFEVGGQAIRPVDGTASAIEYAYAFYNPTTGALSNAVKAELPEGLSQGFAPSPGLSPMGAWALLEPSPDATLAAAGYTRIKVFRRRLPTSGGVTPLGGDDIPTGGSTADWRDISFSVVINNSGTPSFTDKVIEADLVNYPVVTPEFSNSFAATTQAQAIGVWKQHLVLGLDRRLFFSFPGLPYLFMPSPEEFSAILDEPAQNLGRTVYMSSGKVEPVLDIVAQDVFYALGDRAGYAMIGDTAGEATPPRLLNGSRGSVSRRGQAGWLGGVLAASRDGLWWVRSNRQLAYVAEDTAVREETTDKVRLSWRKLFGTSGSNIVVAEYDDEVWVFNNYTSDDEAPGPGGAGSNSHTRYMRLTQPLPDVGSRAWEEGTFPAVVAAAPAISNGLRVMLSNGTVVRVGKDANGAQYTSDAGVDVDWTVESGKIFLSRRKVRGIQVNAKGTPTVTIVTNDGVRSESTFTKSVDDGRVWMLDVRCFPGFTHKVTVTGLSGRDELYDLILHYANEDEGAGS